MSVEAAGGDRCIAERHAERSTRQRLTGRHRGDIGRQRRAGRPTGRLSVGEG